MGDTKCKHHPATSYWVSRLGMATDYTKKQKRKRQGGPEPTQRRKRRRNTKPTASTPGDHKPLRALQKLPDDVLWYIARTFIWDPTGVYDIARTSVSLWRVLEREIYITDVFATRHPYAKGLATRHTTLLHWAAVAGRVDVADKALEAARLVWRPYVDFQHVNRGHAAIHFAAHYGRLKIVKLLQADGTTDVTTRSGWMCLAPQRLSSVLERLTPGQFRIPPGYLLDSPQHPFKIDALGLAVLKGHEDVALHLMSGYDEKRHEEEGLFPALHLAAFVGMHEVVSRILARGTDVNLRCRHVGHSTPMQWAVAGAVGSRRRETLEVLSRSHADLAIRDAVGRTALDWAIGFKMPENVKWVLERPTDVTVPGYSSSRIEAWTMRLQMCMADDRLLDCSKMIVERYPRLPEECLKLCAHSTFWDMDRGWDELGTVSTSRKNAETKRWLVEEELGLGVLNQGARQGWMQDELFVGRSFLHYAAGSNHIEVDLLEEIIKKRPQDINHVDAKGMTPLELALGYQCLPQKTQILVRYGADPALCYGGVRARADIDSRIKEIMEED